jgi:hypothetical protein
MTSCVPPDFVEEALHRQVRARGQAAERGVHARQVLAQLAAPLLVQPELLAQPGHRRAEAAGLQARFHFRAQPRHAFGQLVAAAGASPSQKGMLGGAPCASSTRTRPGSTRRMR